ncbi:MAG: hypothetical protein VZS44_06745 [Bacilli bacterium]|nr:hypothetical protein [Bacilli bacterium]
MQLIKIFNNKNKSNKFYLNYEDKLEYLNKGKRIPLRVKDNGRKFKTLVKARDPFVSGELNNKKMGL